ncbi:MAG: cupredoxin domain-containing protein [Candidatus Omnitrophota bacterium]
MKIKNNILILGFLFCGLGILAGLLLAKAKVSLPVHRQISIVSYKYGYEPAVIRVNQGDTITLKLKSKDVTHGFYLEGYDFDAKVRGEMPSFWIRHPSKSEEYDKNPIETYTFVANKPGKFRYRCSITCGSFHPFMQGEMIVVPNYLFPVSTGLALGMVFTCLIYFKRKR